MPSYTPMSDFTDGQTLSASSLNTMLENISWLKGQIDYPSSGFVAQKITVDGDTLMYVRHRHDYLHFDLEVESGTVDDVKIYYDANEVFHDGVDRTVGYTYASPVDLSAEGLTEGQWYTVKFEITFDSPGIIWLYWAAEKPVS